MEKIEFSAVENDALKEQILDQQNDENIIKKEESGDSASQDEQHIYIVFRDGVSVDQGIEAIKKEIFNGKEFQISRRDEKGNAIVAIVSESDTKSIGNLDEVSFVKIDRGANTTGKSSNQNALSESQATEAQAPDAQASTEQKTENSEEETKPETQTKDNNTIETINNTETGSEATTEIRDDIDTITKPEHAPIAIAVFLGLVVLFGYIINKAKR